MSCDDMYGEVSEEVTGFELMRFLGIFVIGDVTAPMAVFSLP